MRPSFARLPKPFLVSVIRERDPAAAMSAIQNSEYDGADAYDLHINALEKCHRNITTLRTIITATTRPVLLLNYRSDATMTDEERLTEMLTGLEAGAAGIDLMGDFFDARPLMSQAETNAYSLNRDASPLELTTNPAAVARQKALIGHIHSMGTEVLLSVHTRTVMRAEAVVPMALEMAARGPDIIKIVTICLNEDDLAEAFRTAIALKKVMSIPYQYQCHGQHAKVFRVASPMLGSSLIFCNQSYKPGTNPDQPLLRSMRTVLQNVDWRVTRPDPLESITIY